MMMRTLLMASVVLSVFSACPVRPSGTDGGKGGGTTLLTGGGSSSSGGGTAVGGGSTAGGRAGGTATGGGSATGGGNATGGGSATGGGTTSDGGICPNGFGWNGSDYSIAAAKCARICQDYVEVRDVVIAAIDEVNIGGMGDHQAYFWVQDTRDNRQGLWIRKDYTDLPRTYTPQVGELVNVRGFYQSQFSTWDRYGYRRHLGEGCSSAVRNDGGILVIEVVDGGLSTQPVTAMPGFGNSMNGTSRPNPELASTRVFIPGPVTLTNATPLPLTRIGVDGGISGYNGFEITGGILVDNFFTFGETRDGGSVRCDWRAIAADGGTVTFPNGLTGIWDTYTHAPCIGNANCGSARDAGSVPFANNQFTYVLYPTECTELQGSVQ